MKKFFTICLALMCTTTFANSKNEFKNALNSLNYELTVEWDQKDKQVFDKVMNKFQHDIQLLKAQGLTSEEIKEALHEQVKDPKMKENILFQSSLQRFDNVTNLSDYIWKNRDGLYATGASWNGEIVLHVAFWTVLAGLIAWGVYNVIHPTEYMCTEYSGHYCEQREQCDSYSTDYDGNSSCDSYSWYEWCGTSCLNGYYYRK